MAKCVTLERPEEGVALLTVCDRERHNQLCWSTIDELAEALAAAREGGARVSVLASGLPGHWLEHAWLRDLRNMLRGEPTTSSGAGWFAALHELSETPVVSIAAIAGDCSGGGAELGWACDLRVAEEQAGFSQPEVRIGLGTGIGGTSRLLRLIGRSATAEMVLDGAPLDARRLHALGGINRLVPEGRGVETALAWAGRLARRPPAALATLKQMLVDAENLPLKEALASEQRRFQALAATPEAAEGMEAIQRRFDAGESMQEVYER